MNLSRILFSANNVLFFSLREDSIGIESNSNILVDSCFLGYKKFLLVNKYKIKLMKAGRFRLVANEVTVFGFLVTKIDDKIQILLCITTEDNMQ